MKMRGYLKIGIALVFMFILFLTVYAYLGGFRELDLRVVECEEINLIGIDYKGTPQDESLGEAFRKVEEWNKDVPVSTIYYKEPSGKRDTLHVFIGVEHTEFIGDVSGWDQKKISCEQAVRAEIKMHRYVMPGPEKVKQKMGDFAEKLEIQLNGVYIDKICAIDSVVVIAPGR